MHKSEDAAEAAAEAEEEKEEIKTADPNHERGTRMGSEVLTGHHRPWIY